MCEAIKNLAEQRFRRSCQVSASLSLILYIACSQASLRLHNTAASVALAAVAGAALFAELVSVGLLMTKLRDEFQRTLLTRSFVWATLITMGLTMMWGFVEIHSRNLVPHVDIIWVPIILICFTAAAKLLIFRQYRPENE